jgi:phosphatidate cytidylyltransferase
MPEVIPASQPPLSKARIFLRRMFSFVVLWTIVLVALFSGHEQISNFVFLTLMVVLAAAGLSEFYGLAARRDLVCFKKWGMLGGVLLMVGTFLNLTGKIGTSGSPARVNDFETSFLILFVLGLCLCQFFSRTNTAGILATSVTLFGLMYVPWLLNFIQKIYFFPQGIDGRYPLYPNGVEGKYFLLYFILVTKISDSGAYAVGSLIGKHKMIPRISPGKTWEGFGGAIAASVIASVVFAHFTAAHLVGMTLMHAIILGVILGVAAVVGDLIESLFKREAGAKDSGSFFPGIGGILDLLDSLLFNAPIMYLYLRHVLTR